MSVQIKAPDTHHNNTKTCVLHIMPNNMWWRFWSKAFISTCMQASHATQHTSFLRQRVRISSRAIRFDSEKRRGNNTESHAFRISVLMSTKTRCKHLLFSFSSRLLNVLLTLLSIPWHLRWYHNEHKWISHALYGHFNHFSAKAI